jgi:hypothetical protein
MYEKIIIVNPDMLGETIEDLQKAIGDVGGRISLSNLFKMSMLEFISTVASSNGIRFYDKHKFGLSELPKPSAPMKPPRKVERSIQED